MISSQVQFSNKYHYELENLAITQYQYLLIFNPSIQIQESYKKYHYSNRIIFSTFEQKYTNSI